jgi:hypothetical protein
MVKPSDSRKSIWMNSVDGGFCDGGRVKKTYVSELKWVLRVVNKAERLVSPGAEFAVAILSCCPERQGSYRNQTLWNLFATVKRFWSIYLTPV